MAICSRDEAAIRAVAAELGDGATGLAADVRDDAAVAAFVAHAAVDGVGAEQARRYALATLERALDGVGTTARTSASAIPPSCRTTRRRTRSLSELAASPIGQISIQTAQSKLDLGVLDALAGKTVILGVIALDTAEVETPETWPSASAARCPTRTPPSPSPRPTAG